LNKIREAAMPTPTQTVETAFAQLAAALAAEIASLEQLGGEIFHGGAPRGAQVLFRRAKERARIRDEALALHARWEALESGMEEPAAPEPRRQAAALPPNSKTLRQIPGVSVSEAAKALGVTPAKVKEMLTSGHLKGYQRVSGNWKIARMDLLAFIRAGKRSE
jgi:excisionase family DNA binding protein